MLEFCIYSIILFGQVFLLLNGMFLNRRAPSKIKLLVTLVFSTLILRYISLFILFLSKNINHLYVLKSFVFLNIFAIPVGAIVCFYIFIRNSKVNFNYLFILSGLIFIIYAIVVFKYPSSVEMCKNCGYIIRLLNSNFIKWAYLIINTIFLLCAIIAMVNPNVNNRGLSLILIASIMVILENLNVFARYIILPNNVLGDLAWVITMVYAINKVKK